MLRTEATTALLRLAWICPYFPWPLNSGGRLRIHHLASGLAGHELLLFAYPSPDDAFPDAGQLAAPAPFPWSQRRCFAADDWRRFDEPGLPSSATRTPSALNEALQSAHAQRPLDAVIIEHSYTAGGLCPPKGVPLILNEHNIESEYHRLRALRTRSLRLGIEYLAWRRFERRTWSRMAAVTAVSAADADVIGRAGHHQVHVLENAIASDGFEFQLPSTRRSGEVLFLGHLAYEPNILAAKRLALEVLPRLRRHHPHATLTLAGRCPNREVLALAGPGVQVLADPEDIRPLYRRAQAACFPLELGAGTSLKILEPLLCGVPLIATRFATRGWSLTPGTHYTLAERSADLATSLAAVFDAPQRWDSQATSGLVFAKRHTWSQSATRLAQLVHSVAKLQPGKPAPGLPQHVHPTD